MKAGWTTWSLYDCATYQNGRAFKPEETRSPDGMPVIKITELTRGITEATGRFDGEIEERHRIRRGDLIFAWSGTIIIQRWNGPEAALNQHLFRVTAHDGVDQAFLEFLLRSQITTFRGIVEDQRTTMGHVKVGDLKRLTVTIPDLPEQRRIGAILAAIEDKIGYHNSLNELLAELGSHLLLPLLGGEMSPEEGMRILRAASP
jgi:type I restriction enzyme, S subunit